MNENRLPYLIQRYTRGHCTPDEEAELMALIVLSDRENLAGALDAAWDETSPAYRADEEVSARIYGRLSQRLSIPARNPGVMPYRRWLGWVAALLCVATVALYLSKPWTANDRSAAATTWVSKRADQRERIKLPDGSYVTLNEGTVLRYPEAFGPATREVSLEGEAFFEVRANEKHPFIARAGEVSIKVLGTSFNVSAYDPSEKVTVTVSQGRVDVRDRHRSLAILEKDEQVVIDRQAGGIVTEAQPFSASKATAWHRNDLYFDNTTMEEAARTIEERFGVVIQFASPQLRSCRFSGSFLDAADARSVLEVICTFNHMHFRQTANQIFIEGQGCPIKSY